MVGVGLVGYGYAGRTFHCHLIRRAPGLELRAVAARDPERRTLAGREQGVRTHATSEALVNDETIDLVVVATPHDTHAAIACGALEAGKHVVVDKPMALTLADADRMVAAAEAAGRMLSVFHNRRWDWDFLTVRKIIAGGLVGKPYLFESTILAYREPRRTWRANPATMGSLMHDWGAHLIDQALQLVSAPLRAVTCRVARPRPEPAIGNFARVDLEFQDGTAFGIEIGNLARVEKPRWYVLGDEGGLVKYGLDPQERAFRATGSPDAAAETIEERARVTTTFGGQPAEIRLESVKGSWTSYYENVGRHLTEGAPLEVTARQARAVMAVIDAAVKSEAERRPISLA